MPDFFCDDQAELSEFFDVIVGFVAADFNDNGLLDWLFVCDDCQCLLFGFCEFCVSCCEFIDQIVVFFCDVHFVCVGSSDYSYCSC